MANSSTYIVGNLGQEPELRFTNSGQAVCQLSVAVTERFYDTGTKEWKDREPNWYRVNCWRQLAENVVESLHSGDRVIIVGDMQQRSYERDGETRYTWEMTARAIGPELSFAIARTKRVEHAKPEPEEKKPPASTAKSRSRSSTSSASKAKQPANADPWEDEPPF